MTGKTDVAIVGSGIIGMTTALRLSQAGYRPILISKDRVSETTSAVAAAFWYPYKAEPISKVSTWAEWSLAVFRKAECIPEAGIVWHEFSEYLAPDSNLPWWHTKVDGFRCDDHPTDLHVGRRLICHYSVPIIDTSLYLAYLEQALRALDVQFLKAELSSIDEAFDIAGSVVNCSGIGATRLVQDHDLHPVRGQVVRIKKQLSHRPVVDATQEPKIAHVTPRIHDTILGGMYENNESSLEPSQIATLEIIQRCISIFPELGNVSDKDILGVSCGLRPVRSSVRVERQRLEKGWLFHNYGHGGAGFTLSWGCAEEICSLMQNSEC
jgi:D-amino-acid oxidase